MTSTLFFLAVAAIVLVTVAGLLRSRLLREKYAALWILISLPILVLAIFPDLLESAASLVGVAVPSNLLFALAILLLLGVALHLSLELSRHDEETRTLAEEAAISRLQIEELRAELDELRRERAAHRSDDAPPAPAAVRVETAPGPTHPSRAPQKGSR